MSPAQAAVTGGEVLAALPPSASLPEAPGPVAMPQEESMKTARHPTYRETIIACACGALYPTRSTVSPLRVAVCAACHPWWAGRQKPVETAARVENSATGMRETTHTTENDTTRQAPAVLR